MDDSLAQSNKNLRSQEWVREYFATVDKLNVDNIIANFAEDGQFRFGNAQPAVGKEAIRNALIEFFSAINAMYHENIGLWLGDNNNVFEAEVTYTRQDGTTVTLPCVSIFRFRDNLIYDFRKVMDAAPVFAA
jgi:ketosteroid isomerase-like protein